MGGFSLKIEVECRNLVEAEEAITAGAHVIMLDNFKPEQARDGAKQLKSKYPHVLIEVSGGLTEETIAFYMHPDVDILSLGCLSQSVPHVDYSMKIVK